MRCSLACGATAGLGTQRRSHAAPELASASRFPCVRGAGAAAGAACFEHCFFLPRSVRCVEIHERGADACPMVARLAWHGSGTFDKSDGSGGLDGATMRFDPESAGALAAARRPRVPRPCLAAHWPRERGAYGRRHSDGSARRSGLAELPACAIAWCADGANAGLGIIRDMLHPVAEAHPEISRADLWGLAGVSAIEWLGGPHVPYKLGRTDAPDGSHCPVIGALLPPPPARPPPFRPPPFRPPAPARPPSNSPPFGVVHTGSRRKCTHTEERCDRHAVCVAQGGFRTRARARSTCVTSSTAWASATARSWP